MQHTTLGRTQFKVSVAGLGAGGSSRVGLSTSRSQAVGLIRHGIDLGINFIDTARNYETEDVVGEAISQLPRDQVIVSTKSGMREGEGLTDAKGLVLNLEDSLRKLRTDYIDVYHLHAVRPHDYRHAKDVLVPVLLRQKEKGKIRAIGITESAPVDHHHDALRSAIADDPWDVIMLAFNMMHQNARDTVFPVTREKKIGTLMMFVVRNIFSRPDRLVETMRALAGEGKVPASLGEAAEPLSFLIHEAGAESVMDAAYRYVRHEPGVDVVLFGTGSREHMAANIASINRPPLPEADRQRIRELFGALVGVGLDSPDRPAPLARS